MPRYVNYSHLPDCTQHTPADRGFFFPSCGPMECQYLGAAFVSSKITRNSKARQEMAHHEIYFRTEKLITEARLVRVRRNWRCSSPRNFNLSRFANPCFASARAPSLASMHDMRTHIIHNQNRLIISSIC